MNNPNEQLKRDPRALEGSQIIYGAIKELSGQAELKY